MISIIIVKFSLLSFITSVMTIWWISMFFIVGILLAFLPRAFLGNQDYWSDNFDPNKNCEAEEEIKKLSRLPQPKRCAVAKHGNNFTNYHQDNAYFRISLLLPNPTEQNCSLWSCFWLVLWLLGNDNLQWEECKKKLTKMVVFQCMPRNINMVSQIFLSEVHFSILTSFKTNKCPPDCRDSSRDSILQDKTNKW